ncbi:MAG: hypothetical protein ABIJ47_10480 [Candidatus Bathyarchaeota archaeon]
MNPRTLTLRYLGWCPGANQVAAWVPDKEYSDKQVFRSSMFAFAVIISLSLYSFTRTPQSYSWDIEFTDAPVDDITGDYMVRKTASMDGVYNISIWAESTPGEYILIRFTDGREYQVHAEWRISDGVVWLAQEEYGSIFDSPWGMRSSTAWKIYSSSRDQKAHIRITYWKTEPVWPS